MPMKGSGPATDFREIDRRDEGVGWIAYPNERMQRASHAFVVNGEVWVVDPVDVDGLDDLLAEYGEVAGVVTLLDRHKRDAATVANRHDVAVHVPDWMDGVASEMDAPVERVRSELTEGCGVHRLIDNAVWQEAVVSIEDSGTLIVPEAVGTAEYFLAGSERLGVHPALRLIPPRRKLRQFSPERVLVGHGAGVHEDAAEALSDALDGSRSRAPGLYAKTLKQFIA